MLFGTSQGAEYVAYVISSHLPAEIAFQKTRMHFIPSSFPSLHHHFLSLSCSIHLSIPFLVFFLFLILYYGS